MGAVTNAFEQYGNSFQPAPKWVDFDAVREAALNHAETVAMHYLPDGHREQNEWVALNPTRADGRTGSFKYNLVKGIWTDFATGEGGDAIALVSYLEGKQPLDAARDLASLLGVAPGRPAERPARPRPVPQPKPSVCATLDQWRTPAPFPAWTAPDDEGKPRFMRDDENGPRVRNTEKRRHVYSIGGAPARIKILGKVRDDDKQVYRVTGADGVVGWQYRKPAGFLIAPFVSAGAPDPFASSDLLFWPEGEKDTDTVARLKLDAFCFGGTGDGLPAGCEQYVTGRNLIILADNDDAGRKHAEDKARLAHGKAASVRVVHFADLDDKGDVTDWIATGHTAEDLKARAEMTPEWQPAKAEQPSEDTQASDDAADDEQSSQPETANEPKAKTTMPPGFSFGKYGLMYSDMDDLDKPAVTVAGHFMIEAETRNGDGDDWGVLIRWTDNDNREHRLAIPRAALAGDGSDARRMLMSGGFYISPTQRGRSLFNSFLLQVKSPARARATNRVGWHGNAFVLPDDCFSSDKRESLLLQTATANEHAFRQSGTLESWQQNVARYAAGNSRLVLAISAAFAGPLVGPCSAEGGGIHLRGASSTGKSTALHVGGSVWGGGEAAGYVRSWRATSNGLEGVALAHSDTFLCLDELAQIQAREAGEVGYMLANGSGKSRSARDGSARQAARWRIMFLSSGEISLADKAAEDGRGKKLAAGQHVRIVDLPADAGAGMGLFETIHGFATPDLFARHLREATAAHYGVAARAYLAAVVPNLHDLQKQVAVISRSFCEAFVPPGADGQIERVAQRFALIAAGGEIAIRAGVLPWPAGEAVKAAGKCFDQWLDLRGGIEPAEVTAGIEQVRSFLHANGMARFIPAWDDDAAAEARQNANLSPMPERTAVRDVAGYRERTGSGWDFYITSTGWKEICAGLDARRTASALADRGFVVKADDGRLSKTVRIPSHGRLRLYHVPASFLEDDDHA